jgi:hypothetical protein
MYFGLSLIGVLRLVYCILVMSSRLPTPTPTPLMREKDALWHWWVSPGSYMYHVIADKRLSVHPKPLILAPGGQRITPPMRILYPEQNAVVGCVRVYVCACVYVCVCVCARASVC